MYGVVPMTAPSRVPLSRHRVERVYVGRPSASAAALRQTEVEHLHRAVGGDLDVGRLEIAVNDAALVRGLQRRRRSAAQCSARPSGGSRSARDTLGQRLAFDELQDEAADARAVFDAVDRADVRMVERGEQPGFTLEARPMLRRPSTAPAGS